MAWINELATTAKCPTLPFNNMRKLPPDNGEVFLSKYFVAQKKGMILMTNVLIYSRKEMSVSKVRKKHTSIDFRARGFADRTIIDSGA